MKRIAGLLFAAVTLGAATYGGYWWGRAQAPNAVANGARAQPAAPATATAKGRILHYRNPMGLPDTSPVPKKDPMGMDYVPVYEGQAPEIDGPVVKISLDKVQKLGVRTEPVARRALAPTVRAVATVQADERRLHAVAPKFEGWIEKLYVNATGQAVSRGQPLMEVYSPDLLVAQQDYVIAVNAARAMGGSASEPAMRDLVEGALARLRNWDISEEELSRLRDGASPRRTLVLRSQANGVVLEKMALQGRRFMSGETLFQIADLSSVWLLADVFEHDLGAVRVGQAATITIAAYPGQAFKGTVTFIYPTVMPETRTAKVRIEMPNRGALLKPAMYATVQIAAGRGEAPVLAVPDSAVLDSGTRQVVLVRRGEGAFEPRDVKLGRHADGYVEVREGLAAEDNVVVSANFLIDAESNLKAALAGFGSGKGAGEALAGVPAGHSGH